jgi:hypothetical protein
MKGAWHAFVGAAALAVWSGLGGAAAQGVAAPAAASAGASLGNLLAGKTLSAVVEVMHAPGAPGGGLGRIMFQAYLRPGGSALVRVWDTARNAYTPASDRRWSLDDGTLCLDLPRVSDKLCVVVHVWGPRIGGYGPRSFALLDGDLAPGNTLGPAALNAR